MKVEWAHGTMATTTVSIGNSQSPFGYLNSKWQWRQLWDINNDDNTIMDDDDDGVDDECQCTQCEITGDANRRNEYRQINS